MSNESTVDVMVTGLPADDAAEMARIAESCDVTLPEYVKVMAMLGHAGLSHPIVLDFYEAKK